MKASPEFDNAQALREALNGTAVGRAGVAISELADHARSRTPELKAVAATALVGASIGWPAAQASAASQVPSSFSTMQPLSPSYAHEAAARVANKQPKTTSTSHGIVEATEPAGTTFWGLGSEIAVKTGVSAAAGRQEMWRVNSGKDPLMHGRETKVPIVIAPAHTDTKTAGGVKVELAAGGSIWQDALAFDAKYGGTVRTTVTAIEKDNKIPPKKVRDVPAGTELFIPYQVDAVDSTVPAVVTKAPSISPIKATVASGGTSYKETASKPVEQSQPSSGGTAAPAAPASSPNTTATPAAVTSTTPEAPPQPTASSTTSQPAAPEYTVSITPGTTVQATPPSAQWPVNGVDTNMNPPTTASPAETAQINNEMAAAEAQAAKAKPPRAQHTTTKPSVTTNQIPAATLKPHSELHRHHHRHPQRHHHKSTVPEATIGTPHSAPIAPAGSAESSGIVVANPVNIKLGRPAGQAALDSTEFPKVANTQDVANAINAYILRTQPNSPFVGHGDDFVKAGLWKNVNPAMLVAFAVKEQSLGTASDIEDNDDNNSFGISGNNPGQSYQYTDSDGALVFSSKVAGIYAAADYIRAGYLNADSPFSDPDKTVYGMMVHYTPTEPSIGQSAVQQTQKSLEIMDDILSGIDTGEHVIKVHHHTQPAPPKPTTTPVPAAPSVTPSAPQPQTTTSTQAPNGASGSINITPTPATAAPPATTTSTATTGSTGSAGSTTPSATTPPDSSSGNTAPITAGAAPLPGAPTVTPSAPQPQTATSTPSSSDTSSNALSPAATNANTSSTPSSGSGQGSNETTSGSNGPESSNEDSEQIAKQILDNNNISLTGTDVEQDVEDAANGQPGTAGVPTATPILNLINTLGEGHTVSISAIQSGGTGHCLDSAGVSQPKSECPDDPHYNGDAVDIYEFDGQPVTGRDAAALAIMKIAFPLLPDGSGFGQSNCGPDYSTTSSLPNNDITFTDSCTHLHVQVPAGTA